AAEPADPAIEAIGDEHSPRITEHAEAARAIDLGGVGRTDVTAQSGTGRAGDGLPGHGRHRARGQIDSADTLVQVVSHVEIGLVQRGAPRAVELGLDGCGPVRYRLISCSS